FPSGGGGGRAQRSYCLGQRRPALGAAGCAAPSGIACFDGLSALRIRPVSRGARLRLGGRTGSGAAGRRQAIGLQEFRGGTQGPSFFYVTKFILLGVRSKSTSLGF